MTTLPLQLTSGHMFAEIRDELWVLDTGSPVTFGKLGGESHVGFRCVKAP